METGQRTTGGKELEQNSGNIQKKNLDIDLDYSCGGGRLFYKRLNASDLYVMHFGRIPNFLSVALGEVLLQIENLTEEEIRNVVPDTVLCRFYNVMEYDENSDFHIPDETQMDEDFTYEYAMGDNCISIVTDSKIIVLGKNVIQLYYNGTVAEATGYVRNLISKISKCSRVKSSRVRLVTCQGNTFDTIDSELNTVQVDIDKHYNDDFKPVYEDIRSFLNSRSSGLVILHGKKGTGKTNFIRYLSQTEPGKYIIITSSVAARLGSPEFMDFMMRNKDSVFILEDCEQVLTDRSNNTFGEAISFILNMSDGLLSDVFNAKFICTFNSDLTKIDPAILRKGRCRALYEFSELSVAKTAVLLNELGYKVESVRPMTLAEIYHYASRSYDRGASVKKIGYA